MSTGYYSAMCSASFDSAARTYDDARGFPPGVADLVARAALDLLGPGRRVLEIGAGTGRITRPLLARGLPVTGIDLSRSMLDRLLGNLEPGVARPPLAQADAARLPMAAAACDAVISVHVFHLLADWPAALAEVRRVLVPSGVFLNGYEWRPPDSPGSRLLGQWRTLIRVYAPSGQAPGGRDFDDLRSALLDQGAQVDEQFVGAWTVTRTLAQHLEAIEHRTWSSAWAVSPDFFPRRLAELRAWALQQFGSLDREFRVDHQFVWQRFTWPRASRSPGAAPG